jgi:hypothetical protein
MCVTFPQKAPPSQRRNIGVGSKVQAAKIRRVAESR